MRGNSFGKLFSITSFGESHGPAMGVVIDGVPAGLSINLNELQQKLAERAPGKSEGVSSRKEPDLPIVLSGILDGITLGTPIAVTVENTNQNSKEYDKLKNEFRPGHADKTTIDKFGIRDHRGGGRSSGRETISRVIGGYFASLVIPEVSVLSFASKIGEHSFSTKLSDSDNTMITKYLSDLKSKGESVGGTVSVVISGVEAGLGEPVFDKLKADLAHAMLSIGGCVSFSFGLGEKFSDLSGSESTSYRSNFGGMEGGISNGEDITLSLTFKPTSTIGDKAKEGRHDPCLIPRVIPVVKAMCNLVIADHKLRQKAYN
jgi:chorismate synthase